MTSSICKLDKITTCEPLACLQRSLAAMCAFVTTNEGSGQIYNLIEKTRACSLEKLVKAKVIVEQSQEPDERRGFLSILKRSK